MPLDSRIKVVRGTAIPKPQPNQDTDDIIPSDYLNSITFKEMGKGIYGLERLSSDGIPKSDHPFNNPSYQGAKVALVGQNYGCGSSRQHAVFAVHGWGIRAVLAPSYAEIFEGNAPPVGLVAAYVTQENLGLLVNAVVEDPKTEFEVDLDRKEVRYKGKSVPIDMPEGTRQAFLTGSWDSLPPLMKDEDGIRSLEQRLPYLSFGTVSENIRPLQETPTQDIVGETIKRPKEKVD
jgi:3-isopropylmalate/(R)-2-methylmalate dehydratase small subunit